MAKKIKIPLAFQFIRWLFPKLEKWSPSSADWLAINLFLRPLRMPLSSKAVVLENKAEKFTFQANGNQIHGYHWGEGPLVVLAHGWSGRGLQFYHLIPLLIEKGYSVATFDAWGHGKSKGHKSSVLELEAAISAIIEKYGSVKAVIGHSLGAAAALLSRKKEAQFEKLVMISSPVTMSAIIQTFSDKVKSKRDLRELFNDYSLRKFDAPFKEFTAEHFAENLEPFPILIIHDEFDRESPVEESFKLKALLPFAELKQTEKLGHVKILGSKEVHQWILDFID